MKNKKDLFYLLLIFFIWLLIYLICTFVWKQQLGWDDISYLATAKGIQEHFDFSSRYNTVMGLIKYPFPQHTHHYPLYSIYIAIFFKLFGTSLKVAYFSTWFSALITCIFIYLTMNLMTENKLFSFIISISFLFLPRILNSCDSAMMEIAGCALVSGVTYFIFKDLSKNKLNPFTIGILVSILYLFKSIFIGIVLGFFVLIYLKVKSKSLVLQNSTIYLVTSGFLCFIFTKFIFLPLAPMMNFDRKQEDSGIYADFLGGFFLDPFNNLYLNLKGFVERVLLHYFPKWPLFLLEGEEGFFGLTPSFIDFGLYVLIIFYVLIFLIFFWKKLTPLNRLFIVFTLSSILFFNLIFNLIVLTNIGQRVRLNMVYVPLLLISSSIFLKPELVNYNFKKLFIIVSSILLVYAPFAIAELTSEEWSKNTYHLQAHKNSEIVTRFTGNTKPYFIYFHTGTHTTWDSFPIRVILQEATNNQISTLNLKLPEPIEYLFLQPENKLFKENQELILKGKSIINNAYIFHGADVENRVVVYKYAKN